MGRSVGSKRMQQTETTTLFCIPHAGGNGTCYALFGEFFPNSVRVVPLDLPGKGRRCREQRLVCMEAMGRDLLEQMRPTAHTGPYAIFGHSMGGLLAFECARQAHKIALPLPRALFISAAATPDKVRTGMDRPVSELQPGELWEYIIRMGGTPPGVALSADLKRYMEPLLVADFSALESWRPAPCDPLPVAIHACIGMDDTVTEKEARQWQQYSSMAGTVRSFSGGHFYIQHHGRELAEHITHTLSPVG